jgi:hypothetical protein
MLTPHKPSILGIQVLHRINKAVVLYLSRLPTGMAYYQHYKGIV